MGKRGEVQMLKWLIAIVVCASQFVFADPLLDRTIDPSVLQQLASTLGISKEQDLIEQTQKQWLRKPGNERWEMSEIIAENRQYVLTWAAEQGLFSDWRPSRATYDKALILGATTSRMQMRLDFLKDLWNQGVRFREIVWLTGMRPLDPRADGLIGRCANESEAAHILWDEADLPEEMRCLSVSFIEVPMKGSERPNTADTIIAWVKESPEPCTALFVSDQPFCGYQFAVIKSNLPDPFLFDMVGKGVDPSSHPAAAAITLDSIARWIYEDARGANLSTLK
jgi:hypothetical protein